MRILTILLASAALAAGTAATAQTTSAPTATPAVGPALAAGATVYDPTGTEAGTVDSLNGDLVVVSTGTNKISMPKSSFGTSPKGPTVSVTKAQIDAAAGQAAAQQASALKTALVVGAPVKGTGGVSIGTVKSIAADNVVVQSTKGPIAVPLHAFSAGASGLMIAMTAAEFEAAATAATASATPQ